jgi:hypothetical protein
VDRVVSGNIFKNQGSSWKVVDCRIIVEKDKGLNEKSGSNIWFGIIF